MLSPQVFHWMNATKKITGKSKEIILNCCEELLQNVWCRSRMLTLKWKRHVLSQHNPSTTYKIIILYVNWACIQTECIMNIMHVGGELNTKEDEQDEDLDYLNLISQ